MAVALVRLAMRTARGLFSQRRACAAIITQVRSTATMTATMVTVSSIHPINEMRARSTIEGSSAT
mgnify:CR=1 FL=1